jgi:hypothetical protein
MRIASAAMLAQLVDGSCMAASGARESYHKSYTWNPLGLADKSAARRIKVEAAIKVQSP